MSSAFASSSRLLGSVAARAVRPCLTSGEQALQLRAPSVTRHFNASACSGAAASRTHRQKTSLPATTKTKGPASIGESTNDINTGGIGDRRLPRVGTLVLILTVGALAATGTGLYMYYASFSTWPKEVREELRAAVKMRNAGEFKKAEKRFRRALEAARGLSADALGQDKLLKVTGISIALGSMLEDNSQLDAAYSVYLDAFKSCCSSPNSVSERTGPERARAVALSMKLGEIAQEIAEAGPALSGEADWGNTSSAAEKALKAMMASEGDSNSQDPRLALPPPALPSREAADEAAEAHLVWSVEELLRITVPHEIQAAAAKTSAQSQSGSREKSAETDSMSLAELELPKWVTQQDLIASLESLGSAYAKKGRIEYAVPLYLQTLELLIPTRAVSPQAAGKRTPASITVADRCRAAVVMNNLSQVFLEGDVSPNQSAEFKKATEAAGGKGQQATAWAKKGLQLVQGTNAQAGWNSLNNEPSKPKAELVGAENTLRTEQVKRECLRAEITLLVNLGALAQMADDKCAAREYLQRAYRLADKEGFGDAKRRAASQLGGLERFKRA